MNPFESDVEIEIDRLILRGMGLTPERVDRLRKGIEQQLQQLFRLKDALDFEMSRDRSVIAGSEMRLASLEDDSNLACEVARSIAKVLRRID